ncbi:MAG: phosphoglycerate kinase, partial [Candidatus Omnitrophica bacterium]|nr:phosphoglycerate kinase [Candidatus Omnitrophota bacterium]
MRVTLKIISLVLAAGFLATSAFAAADSRLRPSSVKTSGQRMFDLREDVVAIGEKDGGSRQVITLSSLQKVVQAKKINSGFIALDWNIKKIKKTEDLERIIKSLDTIEYSFKDLGAQYAYGLTSRVRPKAGVFTKELSLEEIVDNARKLMVDRGMKDILVELLSYDLDAAALRIKELKTKNPGKKIFFIFENLRFYEGERSKDEKVRAAFEQRLIDLTNQDAEELFYINEAFDKSHRGKEASMELVQMIPLENRAVGKALEKDLNAVLNFLSILKSDGKLVLYVGGSKFDKMPNIAEIAKVFGNRLTVVLGGAQVNPWRSLKKKSIGLSLMPSGEELEGTQKALEDIERFGAKLVAAEDFTVAEMRDGVFTVVGEDMVEISGKQMQVDIGLRSIQQLKDIIGELGPGDGFIMNGGAGKFDEKDPVMSKGSFALVDAALEAKKIGVANLGAGGDMFELLKKYELEVNPDILKLIDFSTGGGVNWAIIGQGAEKLPAIDAVLVPAGRAGALADGGMAMTNQVKVLDNHVGLFEGADTGTSNAMHARAQGADGVIINHSEDRETLELLFQAKANEILKRYTEALNSNLGVESVQAAIKKDFVSYLKRETGIIAPEEKDKDKKKPFVDAGITISYEELNAKVDSWLSKLYEATPENEEAAVERFYRSVTNKVMNIKLKEQIFHSSVYNKPEVILCSGETEKQYLAKRTREVLKEDHEEMLEGISPADIAKINFIRAYEPRWAIGTGKTPTNQEITDTHLFIIEVDKKLTKQEVPVLYGGSMNEKNEEAILNLPGVAGGLIGGKALA